MNIIITMAGLGSRFTKAGYDKPKFLIETCDKTLFEWSMDSLLDYNSHVNKYVFIVRKELNAKEFIIETMKKYGSFDIEVVEIDYLTDGQATTAYLGTKLINPDEELMIYNIDTYIEPYNLKYSDLKGDGFIPCFNSIGDHWSFVKGENGIAEDVVEKVRISDNCSLGAYYFSSARLFNEIYDEMYLNKIVQKEKYIAPMYKFMIEKSYKVYYNLIDSKCVHVLGTPEELKEFEKNYIG